ncbi:MAG: C1 family peptidase [Bacteroidales bacterium]
MRNFCNCRSAVEAMVQIYFNTTGSELNLSEGNLYSECGIQEFPAPQALAFFVSNGVIDDAHWPFPTEYVNNPPWRYYLPYADCNEYDSYDLKAKIPAYGYSYEGNPTLTIAYNIDLKKAIMDYGPIIVMGNGADQAGNKLGRALHQGGDNVNHTVLVTGWNSNYWEIKDSWPGANADQRLVEINFFEYDPHFYCIYPVYDDNGTLKYITVKIVLVVMFILNQLQ